jgi:FAD/FMN-containing dehydrogenase
MLSLNRDEFSGKVFKPGDAGYEEARQVFYGGIDSHPSAIIQVKNTQEIVKVIKIAQENQLTMAVRSGGHSTAGHSTVNQGIVLDLRLMKGIKLNEEDKTVWAESGLTARELSQEMDKHNLAIGFGDTGSVGVGGITLNGGVGFLVRKFGLAIDNLLGAEIVTANGEILLVDENNHPDLFWAIRGGGGNFGVVSKFKFKLHPLSEVTGGMLILPANEKTVAEVMKKCEAAPDELSVIANVMPCPPMPFVSKKHHGKLVIFALGMYAGSGEAAELAIKPLREIAVPLGDTIKVMRYPEIFMPDDPNYHPTAAALTMFMHEVDEEVAKVMLKKLEESDAKMRVVQLRVLGGAMAKVSNEATAFAHRQSKIMVNIAAFYGEADKAERERWVSEMGRSLNQGDNGAYVGFLGNESRERVQAAYPNGAWEKLQQIKQKYDPSNFFRLNQNIRLD